MDIENGNKNDTLKEVILKINGKNIIEKTTHSSSLSIDENGIIIKTK